MVVQIKPERGKEFPRSFTAGVTDFQDWHQIEPLFEKLIEEGKAVGSTQDLEGWLLHQSELQAVLDEEFSRLYIAMTCDTENAEIEKSYLAYLENIRPKSKPYADKLNHLYLDSPFRPKLPPQRYEVMDRDVENDVNLFRKENIPLQTEDSKLAQQYQKTCGAMTVTFREEEKTLQQMAPYLEEKDRALREEVWRLVAARRTKDIDAINDLFDQMIEVRTKIANNTGFDNFRDYQHQAYGRFDYTPQDCIAFQDAVAETLVPLLGQIREQRRKDLGVETLSPWDIGNDAKGRAPLKPFVAGKDLEQGCEKIFGSVDADLGEQFGQMRKNGLLDLESRIGKAPGGYQSSLEEIRFPFIFMNAAGTDRDVYTLLHEGGHAFHAFAARAEPLIFYRHAPIEFCEVASMTMELFGYDYLDAFYDKESAERSRHHHTEQLVTLFPWIAAIDAFQHWIYTTPGHSRGDREDKWLEIEGRFGPGIDWSGLEKEHRSLWQRQLHLFQCPFYYIEYGIAQLGALQVWLQYRKDPGAAIRSYRAGLALGGARPLPELFETAGAKFDFSAETIRPITEAIQEELGLN